MRLGELIRGLEALRGDMVLPVGLGEPMSYRGYYEQLAFEPAYDATVRDSVANARSAVGASYEGYKGGTYVMTVDTPVWLASYGTTGKSIDGIGLVFGEDW